MKLCPLCEQAFDDDLVRCPNDSERLVHVQEREDELTGQLLNRRLRLLRRIGEGGMGSVYEAEQEPIGRRVAVKVLHRDLAKDARAVRRFFNEARVVSRLRHANTITLYDFGQSATGHLFIAMEYLTGVSLDDVLARGELTLPQVVEIIDQICQSLEEAHSLDIVHRDLKPENVFIDRVGTRNIVKVLDFGIAKVPDQSDPLTRTGMVCGTPTYMSPEQAQGHDLDVRSDIYSLGVLTYEMLAGRPPFVAETPMQVALKQVTTAPRPIVEASRYRPLPLPMSALVMDLLEKDRSARPQSIADIRRRLLKVADQLPGLRVESVGNERSVVSVISAASTLPEAWRGESFAANAQTIIDGEMAREDDHTELMLEVGGEAGALAAIDQHLSEADGDSSARRGTAVMFGALTAPDSRETVLQASSVVAAVEEEMGERAAVPLSEAETALVPRLDLAGSSSSTARNPAESTAIVPRLAYPDAVEAPQPPLEEAALDSPTRRPGWVWATAALILVTAVVVTIGIVGANTGHDGASAPAPANTDREPVGPGVALTASIPAEPPTPGPGGLESAAAGGIEADGQAEYGNDRMRQPRASEMGEEAAALAIGVQTVPAPDLVVVRVVTEPPGATVAVVGGAATFGPTPTDVPLHDAGGPVVLTISRDGFESRTITLGADPPPTAHVELVPAAVEARVGDEGQGAPEATGPSDEAESEQSASRESRQGRSARASHERHRHRADRGDDDVDEPIEEIELIDEPAGERASDRDGTGPEQEAAVASGPDAAENSGDQAEDSRESASGEEPGGSEGGEPVRVQLLPPMTLQPPSRE